MRLFDYNLDAFGGSEWDADFLYSNRKTTAKNWRQFFPLIGSSFFRPYEDDPEYFNGLIASIPVMPYPSNTEVDVDFYYFSTATLFQLPVRLMFHSREARLTLHWWIISHREFSVVKTWLL